MSTGNVLIVEDDANLREALLDTLDLAGYHCTGVESAEQVFSAIDADEPAIVVSDVNLSGISGHDLLSALQKKKPDLPVVLMTAYGNIGCAVQAMRDGASDYLIKPFEPEELVGKIKEFIRDYQSVEHQPVAVDAASKRLFAMANKVAPTDATALITGPSGSGKEVIARYIHDQSNRANNPFIAINCAAIPENMLEATLFGHEKGAFTGAHQAREGKFEQSQKGTLLLDEITEMPLSLQAKLLRVIQEREVERIGGKKTIDLDVRILATSNKDVKQAVIDGEFREDLYYRLNVFPIKCLPLKDRIDDIIPLAEHLLLYFSRLEGIAAPSFDNESLEVMRAHCWPGNVREMGNVIQRALILHSDGVIKPEDLHIEHQQLITATTESEKDSAHLSSDLRAKEFQIILDSLTELRGDRKLVADKLGISPRTLRYKMAKMREQGLLI